MACCLEKRGFICSKSEPPPSPDPAEAERTAATQAAALAARAATAGAAEANQTTPMIEVNTREVLLFNNVMPAGFRNFGA